MTTRTRFDVPKPSRNGIAPCLLVLILIAGFTGGAAPKDEPAKDERSPVPDAASQEKSEKLIKELFKDEYARKSPREKLSLAAQFLEQARETKDDLAARFVLMREARDLGAQAGDPSMAIKAVELMAKEYAINGVAMKATTLEIIEKVTGSRARCKTLVEALLSIVEEALAADDFESAAKLLRVGESAARKSKSVPLVTSILARSKEVETLRKEHDQIMQATVTLTKNPEDPETNLAVGKYLCFRKANWDKGLPMLVLGNDAKMKAIAERDVALPEKPSDQATLGDLWWDLAQAEKGPDKGGMQKRACHWYKLAVRELTGLTKTKVEKRITQIGADLPKAVVPNEAREEVEYLSDMEEFDVKVAEGRFANKGKLGYSAGGSDRIRVNGKECPNGLSMHALSNTHASVKYKLRKTAHKFTASVALNDSAGGPGQPPGVGKIPTALTFEVLGDGKSLWKSKPVDAARKVQECKIDVRGVEVLELRVNCPGSYVNAQAVWLEPHVLVIVEKESRRMPIRDGMRTVDTILRKVQFNFIVSEFLEGAHQRAKAHETRFIFHDCQTGYSPENGNHEIDVWQLSLMFGEYTAGLLALKATEGHCQTKEHLPCTKMAKGHMEMLIAFKNDLQNLVNEIEELEDEVKRATKDLQEPSQSVAWNLGLRERPPEDDGK
jgi:hypothetical protein